MTTIAANRKEVYGDLQYTNGGYKFKGNGKVFRFKAHERICSTDFIAGFAGTGNELLAVKYFFENPDTRPPRTKDLYGVVLTADGTLYRFDNYASWFEVQEPYTAIGSGRDYAMGALAAGKSPKEAVKIAIQHDIYTGMGVKGYSI